jgi:hypothetical protein
MITEIAHFNEQLGVHVELSRGTVSMLLRGYEVDLRL